MRYKLLIIDDEPYILNWLAKLFLYQNKYNIDVFRAESAAAALKQLEQYRMDIILSDIKMPGMDGTELFKIVLSKWPFCKFIFLTAYGKFEYIYDAMEHGVVDFILKTEDDDRILNSVYKAIETIEQERKSEKWQKIAEEQMKAINPIMQNMFLFSLLHNADQNTDEIQKNFEKGSVPLSADRPFFLLVTRMEQENFIDAMQQLRKSIYLNSVLSAKLSQYYHTVSFVSENQSKKSDYFYICSLLQPTAPDLSEAYGRHYLLQMLDDTHKTLIGFLDMPLSCCLSEIMTDFAHFELRYRVLRAILDIHEANSKIILTDRQPNVEEIDELVENKAISSELITMQRAVLAGNSKESIQIFEQYLMQTHSKKEIYIYCRSISSMLEILCGKFLIPYPASSYISFEEFCKIPNVCENMRAQLDFICEKIKMVNRNREDHIVSCIEQYIEDNISSDLALETMAEKLFYNACYLSRVFHQMTGNTISQYISALRLQKAKELLCNTDMQIKEISKKIGLNSHSYFSRFFKQETGMTAQQYREKYYGIFIKQKNSGRKE